MLSYAPKRKQQAYRPQTIMTSTTNYQCVNNENTNNNNNLDQRILFASQQLCNILQHKSRNVSCLPFISLAKDMLCVSVAKVKVSIEPYFYTHKFLCFFVDCTQLIKYVV
jgi:hypothetical protein